MCVKVRTTRRLHTQHQTNQVQTAPCSCNVLLLEMYPTQTLLSGYFCTGACNMSFAVATCATLGLKLRNTVETPHTMRDVPLNHRLRNFNGFTIILPHILLPCGMLRCGIRTSHNTRVMGYESHVAMRVCFGPKHAVTCRDLLHCTACIGPRVILKTFWQVLTVPCSAAHPQRFGTQHVFTHHCGAHGQACGVANGMAHPSVSLA